MLRPWIEVDATISIIWQCCSLGCLTTQYLTLGLVQQRILKETGTSLDKKLINIKSTLTHIARAILDIDPSLELNESNMRSLF
jgi:hypothetical protein